MADDDAVLSKIAKLLAKAEGTDNEHEAVAFFAAAERLMLKHDIDRARIAAETGTQEQIISERVEIGSDRTNQNLFNVACLARSVFAVRVKPGIKRARVTHLAVTGYRADIEYARKLYASLLIQRERMLSTAQASKPSYEHGRSFNHSFRTAFSARIHWRLQEIKRNAQREAVSETPGTDIVLASKEATVKAHFEAANPNVRKSAPVVTRSNAGAVHGDHAGLQADISGGTGTIPGQRTALPAR